MSDRWGRLLADFEAAAALGEQERARFLAERRAEDPEAAAELERLLAADSGSGLLDSDPHRLLDALVPGVDDPTQVMASAAGSDGEAAGEAEWGDGSTAGGADAADSVSTTIGGVTPPPAAGVPSAIGRYEVRERIGRGGFGDVYRGFDPVLKRAVAIKTCLVDEPEVRRRFMREAELAARLVHPNIVTIHDFGSDGEVPYLVQELLPGEDLAHRLARGGAMPLADELRLLLDVAAGLAHAHRAGVVHRDVKPGNLRLLPDGRVKILDFGIARDLGAATALTGDDRAVGTLAYMAPEQARGQKPDARADVHAWGAVAFELLSGRRAVPGDSPAVLVYQLLEGKPPPLLEVAPETPEELAALVDRCLARDPAARPRDGGELLAALEPLAKRLVPSAELAAPAAPWGTRPEARRRGAWLAGASAAAALVVVIVAAWLAWHGSPGGPPVVSPARGLAGAGAQASAAPPGASNAVSPAPAPPLSPAGGASAAIAVATAPPGPAPLPAPSAAPTLAALPSPAGAPPAPAAATGVLQVDARPWGELVRLVAADGRELALPADAVTPLALTLPAGDYTAVLRHPQAGGERSCTAHVEAGGRALCRVELRALRASDLLGGAAS